MWVHKDLLPDAIAIQLDNTAKENKNQYVFCFLGYLVETDVFSRVREIHKCSQTWSYVQTV